MRVTGTISGPTLLDDYITVDERGNVSGGLCATGFVYLVGSTAFSVPLSTVTTFPSGGIAETEPTTISLYAYHNSGVMFDSLVLAGKFCHDGVSGLGHLISANPDLLAILASVRKTIGP